VTSIVWRNAAGKSLRSFGYAYEASGLVTQKVTTANGLVSTEQYGYDSLGRLTSEISLGTTTSAVTYAYDLAGNRTSKQVRGQNGTMATVNYALGQGNRLAGWTVAEDHPRARLDVAGASSKPIGTDSRFGQLWVGASSTNKPTVAGTNFWAQGVEVGAGTQQVVAAIRDAAGNVGRATNTVVVRVATAASYGYNAAGCMTNISYSDGTGSLGVGLTWNGQYQLTAATTNGVAAEQYGYDALSRRVWTASGGVTTYSVYDGAQVIADVDSSGALLRSYTWGPGIDNLLALTVHTGATARTYYVIKDHLGSVHALVDATGNTIEQYRFDAWGRTTVYDGVGSPLAQSAFGNRYVWQGREISWVTGLYYFRARWYDSVIGRWLSSDPIGISGGLNQYGFGGNNPVHYRDPSGLQGPWGSLYGVIAGGTGGYISAEHNGGNWGCKARGIVIGGVVGGVVGFFVPEASSAAGVMALGGLSGATGNAVGQVAGGLASGKTFEDARTSVNVGAVVGAGVGGAIAPGFKFLVVGQVANDATEIAGALGAVGRGLLTASGSMIGGSMYYSAATGANTVSLVQGTSR